jgi:hypothetical protein
MATNTKTARPLPPVAARARGVCPQGTLIASLWAAAAVAYLWTRAVTTIADDSSNRWVWALLAAECAVAVRLLVLALWLVPRREQLEAPKRLLEANDYDFHVQILVPCCTEPLDCVQETLLAAIAARLPRGCTKALWLCDDGADPAKRAFVARLDAASPDCRVRYVTGRAKAPGNGKSLNLNHALRTAIYPDWPATPVPEHHVSCFRLSTLTLVPCALRFTTHWRLFQQSHTHTHTSTQHNTPKTQTR